MHEFPLFDFSIPQCRVDLLHASGPTRFCMCNTCVDMPFLSYMFGLAPPKSPTPKPASKGRASPLKDSPVHDEQEELDDIPVEQMNEEDPASSNVDMDQADYDRESDSTAQESDTDTEEEERRKEQLSGERHQPKQKALLMNLPTLRLTPKIKASPQNAIDEETESDNYQGTVAQKTNSEVSTSIYRSIQMDHIEQA